MVDAIWPYELAESLHMSVAEVIHGRGTPMSAFEMCIGWPEYHAWKDREMERLEEKQELKRSRG